MRPLLDFSLNATRSPSLNGTDPEAKRAEVLAAFHSTFSLFEQLFEPFVNDDVFYEQPEPLRHPMIFYFGHTAVFFINKLMIAQKIPARLDPAIEATCAIGVDEMSWDDLNEAHYEWPSVDAVRAYRGRVRAVVDEYIRCAPMTLPIDQEHPLWVILMGIEHERIHLETSSVLHRQLPIHLVAPHPQWPRCLETSQEAPINSLLPVPGGLVSMSKQSDGDFFGWDSEYGTHIEEVETFSASKYLVSNQEFLAFMKAGGYQNSEWWDEEGDAWRRWKNPTHPVFWVQSESESESEGFQYRTMLEVIEMPWSWPVDLNNLEARAFCRWRSSIDGRSLRLPSEAEWRRLQRHSKVSGMLDWDGPAPGNICMEHFASSCPVNAFPQGEFFDVIGNTWQWSATAIQGYEGFKPHPLYDDFSAPTFDGLHDLIKGGSWASTGNSALPDARYAFRRHFPQHAGLRYVEAAPIEDPTMQPSESYETDEVLSQYCEFHYGAEYLGVPNFPRSCVEVALRIIGDHPKRRALDLGCAVGRGSFELARSFDEVIGLDFSARFIRLGVHLKEHGRVGYELAEEGAIKTLRDVTLEDLDLLEAAPKVSFAQADACNMAPFYRDFDLIIAVNLIDRLYSPGLFLDSIHERIADGGFLVLASPYTWLEEYTPKEQWIGGFMKDNQPFSTLDGLKKRLAPRFEMVSDPVDVPFVLRETPRKYQHTLSQLSVWKKRS